MVESTSGARAWGHVRRLWIALVIGLIVRQQVSPTRHTVYPDYALSAQELAAGLPPTSDTGDQYLPYFFDLIYPLTLLGDRFGGLAWLALSLTVLITGMLAFVNCFAEPDDRVRRRAWMFAVVGVVGLASLANGQANTLILGCFLWGAVGAANADRRAAAWLAWPGFKLYPWALGLTYAALFPRRFVVPLAVAIAACLALPLVFHPAEVIIERYATVVAYIRSGDHYLDFSYLNVRDALGSLGLTISAQAFIPVQILAGAAIVVLLWHDRRCGADDKAIALRCFLLTTFWCVTFGPAVEPQTYLLAAPAIAWQTADAWRSGKPTRLGLAYLAAIFVLGPLQTSLLGRSVQLAVIGSKATCWVMLALAMRQVWLRPPAAKREQANPAALRPSRAA